eukprot:GHVN01019326.1.p2 GENE.GHVN01019326.1~~GHVN01019326.1.p2  ORF type:complete len:116 (-),score=16.19 GHVN01019326.1:27-374(-)
MSLVGGYDSDQGSGDEGKRKAPDCDISVEYSLPKKVKLPSASTLLGEEAHNGKKKEADDLQVTGVSKPGVAANPKSTALVPPQVALKRPNVVTEDLSDLFCSSKHPPKQANKLER